MKAAGTVVVPPRRRATDGRPTALDLFSGCGGLTLGLKQAGFRVIGAGDEDALSVASYQANHRKVREWRSRAFGRGPVRWGNKCDPKAWTVFSWGSHRRGRRMILWAGRSGRVRFADPKEQPPPARDVIKGLPRPGHSGDPMHDLTEER